MSILSRRIGSESAEAAEGELRSLAQVGVQGYDILLLINETRSTSAGAHAEGGDVEKDTPGDWRRHG